MESHHQIFYWSLCHSHKFIPNGLVKWCVHFGLPKEYHPVGILRPHITYPVSLPTYLSFLIASLLSVREAQTLIYTLFNFGSYFLQVFKSHPSRKFAPFLEVLAKLSFSIPKKYLMPINSYSIYVPVPLNPQLESQGYPCLIMGYAG